MIVKIIILMSTMNIVLQYHCKITTKKKKNFIHNLVDIINIFQNVNLSGTPLSFRQCQLWVVHKLPSE